MPNGAASPLKRPTALNAARAKGGRIVAVGTTSLRLLESAATEDGTIQPFDGETSIFITPGYRFRAVDILLTNFHLPRSTLFMLVSAFSGLDTDEAGLCARDRGGLSLLFVWRCAACCFVDSAEGDGERLVHDATGAILKETRQTGRVKFQEEALWEEAPKPSDCDLAVAAKIV